MVHNKTNQFLKLHYIRIRIHSNFVLANCDSRKITTTTSTTKKRKRTKLCSLFSVKLILIRCVSATNTDWVFVMKSHLVLCTICIYNDISNWSSVVNTQYRVIYTAAYQSVLTNGAKASHSGRVSIQFVLCVWMGRWARANETNRLFLFFFRSGFWMMMMMVLWCWCCERVFICSRSRSMLHYSDSTTRVYSLALYYFIITTQHNPKNTSIAETSVPKRQHRWREDKKKQ